LDGTVAGVRAHVEAMLGFEVFGHHLHEALHAAPHE
jgi:hypothetical protein